MPSEGVKAIVQLLFARVCIALSNLNQCFSNGPDGWTVMTFVMHKQSMSLVVNFQTETIL